MTYNIQIYKLPKNNNLNIFIKTENLAINSPYENHPLFSLGYHYFIGRTRDSMNIIDKLETKSDFYYIVNPFEAIIPNYDDNVNNLSKIYLKEDILSLDFYKFWEICLLFDIVEGANLDVVLFKNNLEDMNDGELQAIKLYRQKFLEKNSKKDKYHREYKKNINADLIIINNNLDKENIIIETLLKNIIDVLNCQNKKGNLILKLCDTYTMPTIKIIHLLTSLYKDCYLYKPFFSRSSDNEKYIICKNFEVTDVKKIIINLETIIKTIKINYITDIFIDITQEILQDLFNTIKVINIKLVNQQQIIINDIIKYIKENNYYGDKYHEYRNQQIEATQWWITNFLPPSDNLYKTIKENFEKNIKSTIEKNNLEKEKFISLLIT